MHSILIITFQAIIKFKFLMSAWKPLSFHWDGIWKSCSRKIPRCWVMSSWRVFSAKPVRAILVLSPLSAASSCGNTVVRICYRHWRMLMLPSISPSIISMVATQIIFRISTSEATPVCLRVWRSLIREPRTTPIRHSSSWMVLKYLSQTDGLQWWGDWKY